MLELLTYRQSDVKKLVAEMGHHTLPEKHGDEGYCCHYHLLKSGGIRGKAHLWYIY